MRSVPTGNYHGWLSAADDGFIASENRLYSIYDGSISGTLPEWRNIIRGDRVYTPSGIYRRSYRTHGAAAPNTAPNPVVHSIVQRSGTGILDIAFTVQDGDDAEVTLAALGVAGGDLDPANLVLMSTFADSTEALLNGPVATNTRHTLSWDAAADWAEPSGNISVLLLARDSRPQLIDIHFLTLPIGEDGADLQISRSAITPEDLRMALYWLVATGDAGVILADGEIRGTEGAFAGEILFEDDWYYDGSSWGIRKQITDLGREVIYQRLGVHGATQEEWQRAREADTPGTVTQWQPLQRVGFRPNRVNEWGFDTGQFISGYYSWGDPIWSNTPAASWHVILVQP